jgi:glycosyltransferase involved in cell wall biosynthesis
MKFSLVIPAYNEEKQIVGCLESIARQTVLPDEVILVDNNCKDATVKLAKQFSFVKVIQEEKQGRGYARSAGFTAATGEVIGRIDADSRLEQHWIERVKLRFEQDEDLAGLTGIGITSFLPGIAFLRSTLFSRSYYWFVHAEFRTITMWGATMALRKDAWDQVKDKVCLDDNQVHEDQDISLWIAASGGKIIQDNAVRISTSGQTYRYLPKLLHYRKLFVSTKKRHKENGNLSSKKLKQLSFQQVAVGWVWSFLLGINLFVISVVFFPLDYFIARKLRHTEWIS